MSAPNGGRTVHVMTTPIRLAVLATIESYQTKETAMNEHTARAIAANHDHRTLTKTNTTNPTNGATLEGQPMNDIDFGEWRFFDPSHQRMDKWQALKVLEEASEVVEAAKQYVNATMLRVNLVALTRRTLTNEIADLLQTIANLCDAYNISEEELSDAQANCFVKNLKRGMFDKGPRTHMHREEDNHD